jgi:hypothetical protein
MKTRGGRRLDRLRPFWSRVLFCGALFGGRETSHLYASKALQNLEHLATVCPGANVVVAVHRTAPAAFVTEARRVTGLSVTLLEVRHPTPGSAMLARVALLDADFAARHLPREVQERVLWTVTLDLHDEVERQTQYQAALALAADRIRADEDAQLIQVMYWTPPDRTRYPDAGGVGISRAAAVRQSRRGSSVAQLVERFLSAGLPYRYADDEAIVNEWLGDGWWARDDLFQVFRDVEHDMDLSGAPVVSPEPARDCVFDGTVDWASYGVAAALPEPANFR